MANPASPTSTRNALPPRLFLSQLLRGHGLFLLVLVCWLTATIGAFFVEGLAAWSAGLFYISYDTALLVFVGWATRPLRLTSQSPIVSNLPLTVLVPARNEVTVLPACVQAVLSQCRPDDRLWVLDDGSNDGTLEYFQQYYALASADANGLMSSQCEPKLAVLSMPHSGKAATLNRAWPLSAHAVIVTLDADTLLQPGALDAIREAYAAEPQLVAACGVLTPRCNMSGWGWAYEGFQFFEYLRAFLARSAWERAGGLLLVSGAFAAYRRDALLPVGGYDGASLVEDYELIHRLRRYAGDHALDWRVRVIGAAQALTDAPANLRSFLNQRERWFAGFLQTQFHYHDMVGNPRYGTAGRVMLPVKAIDTLQPLFGLTAFVLLIWFLLRWDELAAAVVLVVCIKLLIDFSYHLWALHHYSRWIGHAPGWKLWLGAAFASLAEPFSFQLLRHFGALRGWYRFLTGSIAWAPQRNLGTRT